jgi:hypothetical protein
VELPSPMAQTPLLDFMAAHGFTHFVISTRKNLVATALVEPPGHGKSRAPAM